MDANLDSYHDRFTDMRRSLSRGVNLGEELIAELLKELEMTKTALRQTKLDLDSECETRRRFQEEVREHREWKDRQAKSPFAVALIDADHYVFRDDFIKRGVKGGEDAADALLAELQSYLKSVTSESNGMNILVRAFANVVGLCATRDGDGKFRDAGHLRAFAAGFSRRQAFFDFIDVGAGKERADLKVQESIQFFLDSVQCKHLVLACAHDAGYAPFLGQTVGREKQAAERITLLEGSTFPVAMRDLGLKMTRFASVFDPDTQSAISGTWPVLGPGRTVTTSTVPAPQTDRGRPLQESSYHNNHHVPAQLNRLGPVLLDKGGRRVDRPLQVNERVAEKLKKLDLCYYFFLRGECSGRCDRNHNHGALADDEFYALWWLARKGRCHRNQRAGREVKDCTDALCVYSHKN